MKTEELLKWIEERGLKAVAEDGRLKFVGPKKAFTPALVKVLLLYREKVLDLLGLPLPPPPLDLDDWPWSLAKDDWLRQDVRNVFWPQFHSVEQAEFWLKAEGWI